MNGVIILACDDSYTLAAVKRIPCGREEEEEAAEAVQISDQESKHLLLTFTPGLLRRYAMSNDRKRIKQLLTGLLVIK